MPLGARFREIVTPLLTGGASSTCCQLGITPGWASLPFLPAQVEHHPKTFLSAHQVHSSQPQSSNFALRIHSSFDMACTCLPYATFFTCLFLSLVRPNLTQLVLLTLAVLAIVSPGSQLLMKAYNSNNNNNSIK